VVFDPSVHTQLITSAAEEMTKMVEMISNQVRQLRKLEEEVATLQHYVELFGDPGRVQAQAAVSLRLDLEKGEVGLGLSAIAEAANGQVAMGFDGGGVFRPVGEGFKTPDGDQVVRAISSYLPTAAIQGAMENFSRVAKDVAARRVALKIEMARTTEAIALARNDAEVQKLTGVLVGLDAALAGASQELDEAAHAAVVQDIVTRADEARARTAQREEMHAEFTEAMTKLGNSMGLMTEPVKFRVHGEGARP